MKSVLLIILSVFILQIAQAQELKASEFKALVNISVSNLLDEPMENELVMFISEDKKVELSVVSNEKGKAQILLPKGKTYSVKYKDLIEKVKYSSFEVPGGVGKYSFDIVIKFEPSDIIELKGVLFTPDGAVDPMSAIELDMMKEVLQLNSKMEIVIAAHSDNSESEEISLEKTQKQAKTIKGYFVKKGISSDRIKALGMGSTEPIAPNVLPEGRAQNNRIEIRVTKKYL